MNSFFVGLQFLTRISLVKQTEWNNEAFGKSVKFFPLIGGVLGLLYAATAYLLVSFLPGHGIVLPRHCTAVIFLLLPILLTGGLHCDGFMDTMDGLFSGRSRERMLEIMKDSRVGANGVMAFTLLMLSQWAVLLDFDSPSIVTALFIMPVIGRLAMVIAIICFPYARPQGMGKAFADHADRSSLFFALLTALLLVLPWGGTAICSLGVTLFFACFFARYAAGILGGLTGDLYGAIAQLCEWLVLAVFLAVNISG